MLLVSTAADLYWLGRYFSRSQALVDLVLDCLKNPTIDSLGVPLSITGSWQNFYQQYMTLSPEGLAEFFVVANNPTSLSACLEATRADAQATRGRISDTLWIAINSLWLEWQERSKRIGVYSDHLALYQWLQQALAAVQRVVAETTDEAVRHLLTIGMLVEGLDHAFRKLATPDVAAPPKSHIEQTAGLLAQELARLDLSLWQHAYQTSLELVQLCHHLPDHKDLTSTREAQQCLQALTHGLADVFAS